MDRREVLKTASLVLGYSLIGSSAMIVLEGCKPQQKPDWTPLFFTEDEWNLVDEISEQILPKTTTPGARDAQCIRYIDQAVFAFYTPEQKDNFRKDLNLFDRISKTKYSKAFLALNQNEKEKVLELVVEDMKKHEGKHIFKTLRELTVTGYCTSEVGTKGGLLDFRPVPGPYQGCIDYQTIGKTWAL